MKVCDLFEAISLTSDKEDVIDTIKAGIKKILRYTVGHISKQQDSILTYDDFWNRFTLYVHEDTFLDISNNLQYKLQRSPHNISFLTFSRELNQNVHGQCSGSSITINLKFIHDIEVAIIDYFKRYADEFLSTGNGENKFTIDLGNMKNIAHRIFDDNREILFIVNELADVIIHELVHVHQHCKQSKLLAQKATTEYRSYLTKSRKRFNQAISQKLTQEDWDIYHASPQEIDAFAHNLVLELINIASNGQTIREYKNEYELAGLLANLQELMEDTRNMKYSNYYKKYQNFNDPTNYIRYNVFKRFMKKVYLEFYRYYAKAHAKMLHIRKHPDNWEMIQQDTK